jgi:hypothetical protein
MLFSLKSLNYLAELICIVEITPGKKDFLNSKILRLKYRVVDAMQT